MSIFSLKCQSLLVSKKTFQTPHKWIVLKFYEISIFRTCRSSFKTGVIGIIVKSELPYCDNLRKSKNIPKFFKSPPKFDYQHYQVTQFIL